MFYYYIHTFLLSRMARSGKMKIIGDMFDEALGCQTAGLASGSQDMISLEEIMSTTCPFTYEEATRKHGAPRGQKRPLRPREVWAIRARLEMLGEVRNLALLNLAIDSKLRGCDLVRLRVCDVFSAGSIREHAMIIQKKTGKRFSLKLPS